MSMTKLPTDSPIPRAAGGARLFGLGDLDGAESRKRPVDEEDLDGDVGLDLGLGEEGDDVAAGQLADGLPVAFRHDALEVLAHLNDPSGLAAVHDDLLERSEPAP